MRKSTDSTSASPFTWAIFIALGASLLLAMSSSSIAAQQSTPDESSPDESPPPPPFDDIAADAYYATPVAELHESGVFEGTVLDEFLCPEGFCPAKPVDRKTVAVWIVRILDGQDPPSAASRFNDVDCCLSSFWPPFIERMVELGVTRGCKDGSGFCPERNLTRAQAAAFLSRAFNLPEGPDPGFSDVAHDAWYMADVAKLKASGITVGCGDGSRFCPNHNVTRAQMATFLHRADARAT